MNLTLIRIQKRPDGIFSRLLDESGKQIAVTLSHAYPDDNGGWEPKIPPGVYTCVRGPHRLHGMMQDFETFEITGVPGHSNLLFHWGNYNEDSEGCECLGDTVADGVHHGHHCDMVTNSKATFARFMAVQQGVDRFTLTITEDDHGV